MEKPTVKRLKYIFLALLAFVVLSIMAMLMMAGYDAFRPIDKPNFEPGMALGNKKSLKYQTTGVDARTTITARQVTHETSSTMPLLDERIIAIIDENAFRSAEKNAKARALNKDYTAVNQQIQDYLNKKDGLSYEKSMENLQVLENTLGKLQDGLFDLMSANDINPQMWQKADDWSKRKTQLDQEIVFAWVDLYARHGMWREDARYVRTSIGGLLTSTEKWGLEVYCLRKLGAEGRLDITLRSVERNWKSLKRSVLSIGPDFKLPYHAPWD